MLYIILIALIFICKLLHVPIFYISPTYSGGELFFTHLILLFIAIVLIRIYDLLKKINEKKEQKK